MREFVHTTDSNPEWKKFKALETFMLIVSRASNRIFVGAPLCEFLTLRSDDNPNASYQAEIQIL